LCQRADVLFVVRMFRVCGAEALSTRELPVPGTGVRSALTQH